LVFATAPAQDQGSKDATDLYDRPVLAVDPGMHTGLIRSQAVDAGGRFAVTGSDDRTVRVWSVADGKLLRTIWIPAGPERVGDVTAVAISPDGSTVAAGGFTQTRNGEHPIYLFERESGNMLRRIHGDLPNVPHFLTFSPDGRYLAAMLFNGLRVFDRDKDWRESFRDDQYGDASSGGSFTSGGRLATTALDGLIRVYEYDPHNESPNFHRVGKPVRAPSGNKPFAAAFSPNGKILAIGYHDVVAVDVLDGTTLKRVGRPPPADVTAKIAGTISVAWSGDGQTLFAAGGVGDAQSRAILFAWDRGGLGDEQRMTYCATDTVAGIDAMPNGRILVASMAPCLGLMDGRGKPIWTVASPLLDLRRQTEVMRISEDGKSIDFGYGDSPRLVLRFDVGSLQLSRSLPNDGVTFAPNTKGLAFLKLVLSGSALHFAADEVIKSVAIAPDDKRFFLGTTGALRGFDYAFAASSPLATFDLTQKWRWRSRNVIWAVNASNNGRVVVTADGDGAIRWHRADDGGELLALQVLPNENEPAEWDWVLWTPEGFYEATPGAEAVLKWVVNRGPDEAAKTLPVSAIAKLHRPNALPLVLNELETARALGIDDLTQARLEVQTKTGSVKPPGGILHFLTIGIDKFGAKAGGLHLDYAAEDARDVATALLESQKGSLGKASLYADVIPAYLPNDKADSAAILDALDDMARSMATNEQGQDVAVILVSSHGEMIDGQFYIIPYDFDAESHNKSMKSAVSAGDLAKKLRVLAQYGKVLLLLDACHSGAVGAQGWATDPDAKVLQDAMDLENVTVLTSSKKNELSKELPEWKHGALAQAFLDALAGAADSQGIVKLSALTDAMENEIQSLTKGRQHLGMHVNFSGDLFVARHY